MEDNFTRLKSEQELYISNCNQNIKQWETFKKDYLALKERLLTLPNQTKYDAMVPLGKFAFMPGRIVHTNEILVLLGDNWFVDRSAKQASEIIQRRLIGIDAHLDKLQKELKMFIDQKKWTSDIMRENDEYVNIEHDFDEKKELETKVMQELSASEKQEQRKRLQEKAMRFQAKINERIQKETNHLIESSEEDEDDIKEVVNEVKQEEEHQKKTVHWIDDSKFDQDDEKSFESDECTSSEDEEETPNVIKITHTNLQEENPNVKERCNQLVNSPADIYRLFHKPKSILKHQISSEHNHVVTQEPLSLAEKSNENENAKFEPLKAFSGDIVEKSVKDEMNISKAQTSESAKKVSKFKQSRLNS